MFFSFEMIFAITVIFWLAILTIILFRHMQLVNWINRSSRTNNIPEIITKLDKKINIVSDDLKKISEEVENVTISGKRHIQRIGLVKFNPFSDTGGKQSFVLCLLDEEDNGLIITALHGRHGTRWYTKMVKSGEGITLKLTQEEKQAIKKARRKKK